jgi:hypothetical protein
VDHVVTGSSNFRARILFLRTIPNPRALDASPSLSQNCCAHVSETQMHICGAIESAGKCLALGNFFISQYNAPLFSCPIWAQCVIVVLGSEVNSNPSRSIGVNGGLVAGVLTVTAMGAATLWIKSPLKVLPLLKLHFLLMPVQ